MEHIHLLRNKFCASRQLYKKMAILRIVKILTLCPIRTNEENQFLALVSSPNKRPLRNATKSLELNEPAENKILHLYITIAHIQLIKILTWREAFWLYFYFWFVFSLLGTERQWSHEKFAILSIKPWSHDIILMFLNVGYYNTITTLLQTFT